MSTDALQLVGMDRDIIEIENAIDNALRAFSEASDLVDVAESEVVRARRLGATYAELGSAWGISRQAAQQWLAKLGVED